MAEVLTVVRTLFDALERDGVSYCHWKSNEHLLAGLAGATDLDVLIDRRQRHAVQDILSKVGYICGVRHAPRRQGLHQESWNRVGEPFGRPAGAWFRKFLDTLEGTAEGERFR